MSKVKVNKMGHNKKFVKPKCKFCGNDVNVELQLGKNKPNGTYSGSTRFVRTCCKGEQ